MKRPIEIEEIEKRIEIAKNIERARKYVPDVKRLIEYIKELEEALEAKVRGEASEK